MKRIIATVAIIAGLNLPAPTADAWYSYQRCPQYEATMVKYAPRVGWDVRRMSYYAWRESRCQSWAVNRTGGDSGLLQIHPVNWPWLSYKFGTTVNRAWLLNPTNNIRAGAALATFAHRAWGDRYRPWRVW